MRERGSFSWALMPLVGTAAPQESAEKWFCSKESVDLKDESTLEVVCSPF